MSARRDSNDLAVATRIGLCSQAPTSHRSVVDEVSRQHMRTFKLTFLKLSNERLCRTKIIMVEITAIQDIEENDTYSLRTYICSVCGSHIDKTTKLRLFLYTNKNHREDNRELVLVNVFIQSLPFSSSFG